MTVDSAAVDRWASRLAEDAWRRSDTIFSWLEPDAFALRPIALRHPLLFYLGHLPAFAYNQIARGVLGDPALDETFDQLFARGIDPESESDAPTLSSWPALDEVVRYRDRARAAVLERVPRILAKCDDVLCARGRVLSLVIEHELMHHETLMYLLAQCPEGTARPSGLRLGKEGGGRRARPVEVAPGSVRLGAAFDEVDFGWDNEFGDETRSVERLWLDDLPVRNQDWLDYMGHYPLRAQAALAPASWVRSGDAWAVRTIVGPVSMERASGWPVQVSGTQARAYCEHMGGRLATEAELHHAARAREGGDGYAEPALVGWSALSPDAVGRAPSSASAFGVEELIGNGWEWTSTVFAPRQGFTPWARTYPGYSADFFDGAHDVVFGASWATDTLLLRPSFRNWYRRDYPYAFTSFRVAYDRAPR